MWSPRSQNDRTMFSLKWRELLEKNFNVDFIQDSVTKINVENNSATLLFETNVTAKSVILTSGTFMNGIIHIGRKKMTGGRMGDKASTGITEDLLSFGFESGRMKTGTPPRLDGRTINYDILEEQPGDINPKCFSFRKPVKITKQHSCHITYTNEEVHDILKEGFDKSVLCTLVVYKVLDLDTVLR